MKPQKSEDYVRHECGHLVAAKVLGFETGEISLTASNAHAEVILKPELPDLAAVKDFIRRRVQILYAGALAQSLTHDKSSPETANELLESTASQDYAKARELVRVLVGIEHATLPFEAFEKELRDTDEALYVAAKNIVEARASTIHAITEAFVAAKRKAKNPQKFVFDKDAIKALPQIEELQQQDGGVV